MILGVPKSFYADSRFQHYLQSPPVIHLIQSLLVLLNLENIGHLHITMAISIPTGIYRESSLGLTIPLTLTLPLSKYATARGKQFVCANEPMIYVCRSKSWPRSPIRVVNTYSDFIAKDLGGWPMHKRSIGVYTIHHQRSTPTDIVDRLVGYLL